MIGQLEDMDPNFMAYCIKMRQRPRRVELVDLELETEESYYIKEMFNRHTAPTATKRKANTAISQVQPKKKCNVCEASDKISTKIFFVHSLKEDFDETYNLSHTHTKISVTKIKSQLLVGVLPQ